MYRQSIKKVVAYGLAVCLICFTACTGNNPGQPKELHESTTTIPVLEKPFASTFFGDAIMENIRRNCDMFPEYKQAADNAVAAAKAYADMSLDDIWQLVFGPEIERSWMVLSDGTCPACLKPVVMYDWMIDPERHPWKLACPHCSELFPKNDYYAYFRSGLDERGRFSHDKADKGLLYNMETNDKKDKFGVDDGRGFSQGGKTFRFIQTYFVYGQWKQVILEGIKILADAYLFTGHTEYGTRALILLDRLADFWPEYDYNRQGWLYEKIGTCDGYISYRIDAAFEQYDLAVSYDKVKEVLFKDPAVCAFLSEKALTAGLSNMKKTPEDIKMNIDERILRDGIMNPGKLLCNAPYTDIALIISSAVLDWPDNRGLLMSQIGTVIQNHTRFDGMTGESGLSSYAAMGKSAIAKLCNLFVLIDPSFVKTMVSRVPNLYQAYRFHIDLYCVDKYYPLLGDDSYFGTAGAYPNSDGAEHLMMYEIYEATKDEDLLKAIYRGNGNRTEGAFLLFPGLSDIKERYDTMNHVVATGSEIRLASIKKEKYQMAVLRTGTGQNKTEIWINYGANKTSHDHGDGMNMGIFYKDADLMPDNGYPNVAYGGGWGSSVVAWTTHSIPHNVAVFNGLRQGRAMGRISLWSIGDLFKVIRANATGIFPDVKKYERTLALVDITDENAYVVDIFRAGNGPAGIYEKYNRSNIGRMTVKGMKLTDIKKVSPPGIYMSDFRFALQKDTVREADWAVEDVFGMMQKGRDMHLRFLDLTTGAKMFTCNTWLPPAYWMSSSDTEGYWLPTMVTEKTVATGETATFVSILEPYEGKPNIAAVERLDCVVLGKRGINDADVALSINAGKNRDIVILPDPDTSRGLAFRVETAYGAIETDAGSCMVRFDETGNLIAIRASKGTHVTIGDLSFPIANTDAPTEINLKN